MGTDSLHNNCYVTVVHDSFSPYGRMVNAYPSEEEAQSHIKFQKEVMGNTSYWSIIHFKEIHHIKVNT